MEGSVGAGSGEERGDVFGVVGTGRDGIGELAVGLEVRGVGGGLARTGGTGGGRNGGRGEAKLAEFFAGEGGDPAGDDLHQLDGILPGDLGRLDPEKAAERGELRVEGREPRVALGELRAEGRGLAAGGVALAGEGADLRTGRDEIDRGTIATAQGGETGGKERAKRGRLDRRRIVGVFGRIGVGRGEGLKGDEFGGLGYD